jgi:DNA polymerase-3 subunit beta
MNAAVAAAAKITKEKTGNPTLGCVLIETGDDSLSIGATDGETSVAYRLPAAVTKPGRICIPASTLGAYLAALPDGELTLESDGASTAILRHGSSRIEIFSLSAAAFPTIDEGTTRYLRDLQGSRIAEAIASTAFAAAKANAEPAVLQGTLVNFGAAGLCLTATDGYRLARYEHGPQDASAKAFVVPLRGLQAIARAFESSPTIDISTRSLGDSENHLVVTDGLATVTSRLVNAEFPPVEGILTIVPTMTIGVDREKIYSALRRAELMTDNRARSLHLMVKNNLCEITVDSVTNGCGHEVLDVAQNGSSLEIDLNAQYLLEIIKHIDTPRVTIGFAGPAAPITIRGQAALGAGDYGPHYLLMPLKISAKAA